MKAFRTASLFPALLAGFLVGGTVPVQSSLIPASGWNVDFVLGSGESIGTHQKPENGNIWFADDLGITPGSGLPAGGALSVSGKDFQLEAFTGGANNVLRGPGNLTLISPAPYAELTLLGSNTGGSGSSTWDFVLNFTDAPSTGPITYPAFGNWAGSGSEFNPQLTSNGTSSSFGGQLNTRTFDLAALGHSGKTLQSIAFSSNGSASGNLAVFGLSGVLTIPEPSTFGLMGLGLLLLLRCRRCLDLG